jgi:hypothetical protein
MIAMSGFDAGRSNVFADGVDGCSGKETVGTAGGPVLGVAVAVGLYEAFAVGSVGAAVEATVDSVALETTEDGDSPHKRQGIRRQGSGLGRSASGQSCLREPRPA